MQRFLSKTKNGIKRLIYPENYFEDLGLYYIGPVNGNSYHSIEKALKEAKSLNRCVVIHAFTKKGKGYEPAEKSPDSFHSVQTGESDKKTLHEAFADELIKLAKDDERIVAITAAMGIGTGLDSFGKNYPERYFDVGIAEEHALTFSAGLAAAGIKPYVAVYSTFLQRAYDNIIHDIALQNLPVKMIIDRAGLAVKDGPTHHGIFDVSFLSHVPNVSIYAPVTYGSLAETMRVTENSDSPIAIRYANDDENQLVRETFYADENYSKMGVVADFDYDTKPKIVFITYGSIASKVIEAKRILSEAGIESGIILVEKLKPYDESAAKIAKFVSNAEYLLFVEEGIYNGGYSMITDNLLRSKFGIGAGTKIEIAAIDDNFAVPPYKCDIYTYLGLSAEKIADKVKNYVELT